MKISQLTATDLCGTLAGPGLFLTTGPYVFKIQTTVPRIAEGIRVLYAEFPIASSLDFADFHLRFSMTRNWRRTFRSYVTVEVDGDSPSPPVPLEQAYAVFEGCLNWCIYTYTYQYLVIHAAALERGGRAVLLPAPPGSGKSTLCAALVSRGWRLLTDELSLIDTESRTIVPLGRPVSLKNESIDVIKTFAPEAAFGPISPNTVKGTIAHMKPPTDSIERVNEHSTAAWLIVPSYRAGATTSARRIGKGEAFMRVAESAVNYMALGELGFSLVSALVDEMSCCRFEYGDLQDAVQWFNELSGRADPIGHGP